MSRAHQGWEFGLKSRDRDRDRDFEIFEIEIEIEITRSRSRFPFGRDRDPVKMYTKFSKIHNFVLKWSNVRSRTRDENLVG